MWYDVPPNFSPVQALVFTQNSVKTKVCNEEKLQGKQTREERQNTHKHTTFTLLLFCSSLEHPLHRFHPLFSPTQALVFALHTQKQASVSYGNKGQTWSAPPLTQLIPSSSSLCTRHLCLRPPLAHRTHPPTQKLTHCFITNPLAAQRHLSP